MEFVTLSDAITIKMNPFYIIQDNIPIKRINIRKVISVCEVSNKNGKAFSDELQKSGLVPARVVQKDRKVCFTETMNIDVIALMVFISKVNTLYSIYKERFKQFDLNACTCRYINYKHYSIKFEIKINKSL